MDWQSDRKRESPLPFPTHTMVLTSVRQLKNPAIRTGEKSLWMQLASLQEQLRPNLSKKMTELVEEGEELTITDKSFPTQFKYKIVFSK
jgi:ubiquitin-activating enzyme E1 C